MVYCRVPEISNFISVRPSDNIIDGFQKNTHKKAVTKTNDITISLFKQPKQVSEMHLRFNGVGTKYFSRSF